MSPTNTQKTEQLLADYTAIRNERDYSTIPDVVSASFERVSPVAEAGIQGHGGVAEFPRGREASFSDCQITTDDSLVGDGVVMAEGTVTRTHDGAFNGIPPTH